MALNSSSTTGNLESLEAVVEIKSSAYKFFASISKEHHVWPTATDVYHDVTVHEGDWETSGSIKLWNYTIDGVVETVKETMEIDEANKKVTLTAVDGHVLEQYKFFQFIFQVTPKNDEGGNQLKITAEYEKLKESDQPPQNYLDLLVTVMKDIDAHLIAS